MSKLAFVLSMIVLLSAAFAVPNQGFASQNSLIFYGKGTASESGLFTGGTIRTLINGDDATIIRTGHGIEVVRMSVTSNNTCIPTQFVLCFDGIVTAVKNTDVYEIGDKIEIVLDFENNKETLTVDSGSPMETIISVKFTKTNIHLNGPYVITVSQEGGIAGIQKNLTIDTASGTVTGEQNKLLDANSIDAITKALKKSKFFDLRDYYPSVEGAADYFTYTIHISHGAFEKTVIWTDTSLDVPKKLWELHSVLADVVATDGVDTLQIKIARDFVMVSPTFAFDGVPESLTVTDAFVLESFPEQHVITINFDSLHGGYGDRTDQLVTQAITTHTAVIKVVDGSVTSAIFDEKWDEINQKLLD